jgi:hypothetical protein
MKQLYLKHRMLAMFLAIVLLFSSCASSTMIESFPSGAELYLNGEAVGYTPYQMNDTKPMFSSTSVRIEKDGYRTFYTTITRDEEADVGAIIGGVFFFFPFVWALKYKPTHFYKLVPDDEEQTFDKMINKIDDQQEQN